MALANAHRFMPYPHWPSNVSSVPSTSTITTLTANGHGVAFVFVASRNKTVSAAHFRTGTVAVAGTATVRVQIETVTTGVPPAQPTGTLVTVGGTVDIAITSADDDVIKTAIFGTPVVLVQGQVYALTITVIDIGALTGIGMLGYADERSLMIPYTLINTLGVYSFSNNGGIYCLENNDLTVDPIPGIDFFLTVLGINQITNVSAVLSSGNNIVLPWPCKVCGAWGWFDVDGTGYFRLVENSYHRVNGTGIIGSSRLDLGYRNANGPGVHLCLFDDDKQLAAGTEYRLIVEGDTANPINTYYHTTNSAVMHSSRNGGGNNTKYTETAVSPTGDSDWAETTTRISLMGLLISAFDDGSTPPPPPTVINGRPVLII